MSLNSSSQACLSLIIFEGLMPCKLNQFADGVKHSMKMQTNNAALKLAYEISVMFSVLY